MSTPPALVEELRWMGIDMLSCANNHATDYGVDGLVAMLAHLRRLGVPHAGAGENLAEARRPAYHDSAAGRVALLAATSFFPPWTRAADQRPDARGRPGINPLGFSTFYTVDDDALAALKKMSEQLGLKQSATRHRAMFFAAHEAPSDDGRRGELPRLTLPARQPLRGHDQNGQARRGGESALDPARRSARRIG